LLNGRIASCGCIKREKLKKYNTYDLSGEYGIGHTFKGEEFYFDLEDYDKIKNHCWCSKEGGYIITSIDGLITRMHRFLLDISDDFVVDHINHKTWDNQKINLRICYQNNNAMNSLLSINNSSGKVGISFLEEQNKWRAYITVDRKQIHLGMFEFLPDAIKSRQEAEDKYFGEFKSGD